MEIRWAEKMYFLTITSLREGRVIVLVLIIFHERSLGAYIANIPY